MKQVIRIALLLAFPGVAAAETALQTNTRLLDEWRACVELRHALRPDIQPFQSAEVAFRDCETEERLFLAALSLSAVTQANKDLALLGHYNNRQKLKAKLQNQDFETITKRLNPKP